MSVNVTYGGSRTEEINSFFQSLLPILAELLSFLKSSPILTWMIIENIHAGFTVMAFLHFNTAERLSEKMQQPL